MKWEKYVSWSMFGAGCVLMAISLPQVAFSTSKVAQNNAILGLLAGFVVFLAHLIWDLDQRVEKLQ